MTITINGVTEKYISIDMNTSLLLSDFQIDMTMPNVIKNHIEFTSKQVAENADYLNRVIPTQDTSVFENVSPFGTVRSIAEYKPTNAELKSLRIAIAS